MRCVRAVIVALILLTVSSRPLTGADDFKMGIPLPLTGPEAKFGEMEKQAYELAAAEINARGGANGHKLALEFLDSGGKPEAATAVVEKLITAGKQPIIVGEYTSQCSLAVAGLAERSRVPYLVVTGAADKITQQGAKYVFRMNPPSSLYATGILSFFEEVAHPKSIAILYENTDFGTSTAKAMKEACDARGIEVVLNLPITERFQQTASSDFKPVLTKVKAANPDVVYMVSYLADALLLMRQAKELDLAPKAFIGGAAGFTMPEFRKGAGSDLVMSGTLWTPEARYPGAKSFFDRFKAKYGKEPDYHGAEAYAAVFVLADVLKRTKSLSPDDLRDALAATELMTAFGPVKFVSWGQFTNQNRLNTLVQQVIKGEFETVWPKDAASATAIYPVPRWKERK
jgi:branched-chain amino acid transport system substrate-binding protein